MKVSKTSKQALSRDEAYKKGLESLQAVIIADGFESKLMPLELE